MEIISNLDGGKYIIKVLNDNNTYNIKKGEQYIVGFNLLRKADLNLINLILSNHEKLNINQIENEKDDKIDTSDDEVNEISSDSDSNAKIEDNDNCKFIKRSKSF